MRITRLLLLFSLISAAHAQTKWTDAKTHVVSISSVASKTGFSADQMRLLQKLDSNLDDLRIEKIDLGSQTGYAVQSFGSEWCGAVGNCTFWILDAHMKAILSYRAQTFAVLPTSTNGQHDIVLRLHASATESMWGLYHFTGTYYRRIQCADVNYSPDPEVILKKPVVSSLPCSRM